MAKLSANSGNPDQMPCSAAPDLGLHCLPTTLLRVSRLHLVNGINILHQIHVSSYILETDNICLSDNIIKSFIKKTRLYNFDPLQPHYYIVKLGFTGVYIIFLISAQKHRLWVLVRTAFRTTLNLCFE